MNVSSQNKDHQAILGLGSNIAPIDNLNSAIYLLGRSVKVEAVSNSWQTRAVGSKGPAFLNAAALIRTSLTSKELKNQVLRPIEKLLGRVWTKDPNSPRTIDLDILIFDAKLVEHELWDYAYLSVPVSELLPNFINPKSGETIKEAADRFLVSEDIRRFPLELHRSSST